MPLKSRLKAAWAGASFVFLDTFSRRGGFVGQAFHLKPVPFALSQSANGVLPLLFFMIHGPAHLRTFAVALLGFKVSVGSVLVAFIVSRYFPILINERELRARNWTGVARRIRWEEITQVNKFRWLYIAPMLRISTEREHHHILLPLFLENEAAFSAQVRLWTDSQNPLHRFLEAETNGAALNLSPEDVALR